MVNKSDSPFAGHTSSGLGAKMLARRMRKISLKSRPEDAQLVSQSNNSLIDNAPSFVGSNGDISEECETTSFVRVPASDYASLKETTTASGQTASMRNVDAVRKVKTGDIRTAKIPSRGSSIKDTPDLGSQVLIFSPTQAMTEIQSRVDELYRSQVDNEFGTDRWSIFFMPGKYNLDVKVGYYTTVHGLGLTPGEVVIEGAVRAKADWMGDNNATINFWRGVENLTVIPTIDEDDKILVWATSQATWLRRVQVLGSLVLSDHGGYSSGGFIADSSITGQIDNGTQQQYCLRNSSMNKFVGGSYAQVFVGCQGAPAEDWPKVPYSNIGETPVVREKPYVVVDADGDYALVLPGLRKRSQGTSWPTTTAATTITEEDTAATAEPTTASPDVDTAATGEKSAKLSTFYIARPGSDTAVSMNDALRSGKSLFLLPGIYNLDSALQVTQPNTVVLGIGLATLKPVGGTEALTVADVDGVTVAGILFDAGSRVSGSLCRVGDSKSGTDHSANPIVLSDVLFRVGGAGVGRTGTMLIINSRHTIVDHTWLWRADHAVGVGWTLNSCKTGLRVEADDVICYGLFAEHCLEYQTLWNGERGQVFFYQSEFPYDPPSNAVWSHSGVAGYASYKVAPTVKTHYATGLGIYCVFVSADDIVTYTAIEHPLSSVYSERRDVLVRHATIVRFGGNAGTGILHVINEKGGSATSAGRLAKLRDAYV